MCSPNIWGNQRWVAPSLGDHWGGWQYRGVFFFFFTSYWSRAGLATREQHVTLTCLAQPGSLSWALRAQRGRGARPGLLCCHRPCHKVAPCDTSAMHKCVDQHRRGQLLRIERFPTKINLCWLSDNSFYIDGDSSLWTQHSDISSQSSCQSRLLVVVKVHRHTFKQQAGWQQNKSYKPAKSKVDLGI